MSKFQNDSIFWIEVDKIKPNPYQPRKEFSEEKLNYLADSIRQYGVLQPLVVTRHEVEKLDGGLMAEYELIAGERRLRASKIAGLVQVPVIIRTQEDNAGAKLELAIIENLQREDLNPIDRALAFQQLVDEFNFKHTEIAQKVGKSREYVSNSLRLLSLPEEMRKAISAEKITEGHSRPLLMLKDRPEEQETLFKEIIYKRLTVRDAEAVARKVAVDKVRKKDYKYDPEIAELEGQLAESLGTRVSIEKKDVGGKVTIDFFSNDDLKKILDLFHSNEKKNPSEMLDNYIQSKKDQKNTVIDVVTELADKKDFIEAEKEVEMANEGRVEESVNDILGNKKEESTNMENKNKNIFDGVKTIDDIISNPDNSNYEEKLTIIPGDNMGSFKDSEEAKISDFSEKGLNSEKQKKDSEKESKIEIKKEDEDDLYSLKDFSI